MAKKNHEEEAPATALAVLGKQQFALAKYTSDELRNVVATNFDGEMTPADLERIRIPSGGQKVWLVPNLEGEDQALRALSGVILMVKSARAYWQTDLDESGGGTPPDCSSADGKRGIGAPGGLCKTCPMNEFKTAKKGEGKACKEMKLLFLLRPESLLPAVVVIPPTSLRPLKQYTVRLTGAAIPYTAVVSEIALAEKANQAGVKFAQASFRMVERLDPASVAHIEEYLKGIRSALESAAVEVTRDEAQVAAE